MSKLGWLAPHWVTIYNRSSEIALFMNMIIWGAVVRAVSVWITGAWSCVASYGEWSTCWATMYCWGKGGRHRANRFTEHRVISRNPSEGLETFCDIKIVDHWTNSPLQGMRHAWPPIDRRPFVNESYKYMFGLPQLRWFVGSHEWEFPLVFRDHWQSPALTTGK